jgi:hypothetical protein
MSVCSYSSNNILSINCTSAYVHIIHLIGKTARVKSDQIAQGYQHLWHHT